MDHAGAIAEVKQWLSYKGLDSSLDMLLAAGYDDLSAISECTPDELQELLACFKDGQQVAQQKQSMSELMNALQQVGIHVYRKQKNEFRRLLEVSSAANAAAASPSSSSSPSVSERRASQISRIRMESMARVSWNVRHGKRIATDKIVIT